MKRAVFLDRDGVINKQIKYITDISQVRMFKNTERAIKILNKNFIVVVITNQPVIARGLCKKYDIIRINNFIKKILKQKDAIIDEFYFCPHHPEKRSDIPSWAKRYRINCNCRKPKTGMIKQAAKEFGIDIKNSYMIGDQTIDVATAKNIGCISIMVKTGYGGRDKKYFVKPDHVCKNLNDAAILIDRMSSGENK